MPRFRFSVHPFALAWLGFVPVACESKYTLEPTFCDDWCRATLKPSCNESPSGCVQDCELTKASQECFSRQERLLRCYERADDSDFVCTGGGFSLDTRVKRGVCERERDALFECEAPGIGVCLQLCRMTQERQLESIRESEPGLAPPAEAAADAGNGDACPLLDQPCETLCWTLFRFVSDGLVAAGVDPQAPPPSGNLGNTPFSDAGTFTEVAECLSSVLLACYLDEPPPNLDLPERDPSDSPRTITEVIRECTLR